MDKKQFFEEIASLSHAERIRAAIALGQRARDDEGLKAILTELARGDFSERLLALYGSVGSGESGYIVRALRDPSRYLSNLAIRLLAQECTDEQIEVALMDLPGILHRAVLWRLRKQRRYQVIDTFLEKLAEGDVAQLAGLLPLASDACVLRLAEQVQTRWGIADWLKLARTNPQAVLTLFEGAFKEKVRGISASVYQLQALVAALGRGDAARTLAIFEPLVRTGVFEPRILQALVKYDPVAVADIVLACHRGYSHNPELLSEAHRLRMDQLVALYTRQIMRTWNGGMAWFGRLPEEQRLQLYREHNTLFRGSNADQLLPIEMMQALPEPVLAQECQNQLTRLPGFKSEHLKYAIFLPWEQFFSIITSYLNDAESEERSQALSAWIDAVIYHPTHIDEILGHLLTRRSEHDTVRQGIFRRIVRWPLWYWNPEGRLETAGELIRHGLNDVGLSSETLRAIVRLLLRLLPAYFAWSLEQLVTVFRERGLPAQLPRVVLEEEQVKTVCVALRPVLERWLEQGKEEALLNTLAVFVGRGQIYPVVAELLDTILKQTHDPQVAQQVLQFMVRRQPEQFARLVPELLARDRSWITVPAVYRHVLYRRTDLMDGGIQWEPGLDQQGTWEQFPAGRERFLPPLEHFLIGATTAQQRRYAQALMEVVDDREQESGRITAAIKALAWLPSVAVEYLSKLANDESSVVRTTALLRLGRCDSREGFVVLVDALQDRRARIAIHVLRPFLARLPASEALALLRTVPFERVTVAKEAVRLIGDVRTDAAYEVLIELEKGELHRDVRMVLIGQLRYYLDREESWRVLERYAGTEQALLVYSCISWSLIRDRIWLQQRVARTGTTYHWQVLQLLATLVQGEQSVSKKALGLLMHCALPDHERLVTPVLLQKLEVQRLEEWSETLGVLFNLYTERDERELLAHVERRKRAYGLMKALVEKLAQTGSQHVNSFVRSVLTLLSDDPMTVILRIDLALKFLTVQELGVFLVQVAKRGEFHASAVVHAWRGLRNSRRFAVGALEELEQGLQTSKDEVLRYLGCACLYRQSEMWPEPEKWTPERLKRLDVYRKDKAVLVATAGVFGE